MKKVFVFLICVLSPFFVFANPMEKEQETYIEYFSYIKLNPDNSIDAGPIFFGRLSRDNFREVKEVHLNPGNDFNMGDGRHAFTTIKYIGPKDGRVIFEETHTFNAISFGGGVSKETKIKSVKPYTFSEFSKGRELEVFGELLTYFDDYFPLYKNDMDKLSEILGPNPMFDGKFPLLLRVSHEKSAIEYLLSKGSDINVKSEGENIIHWVIMNPFGPDIETRLDLIRFFIEKGADINEKDNNGKTALNRVDERIEELQRLIQNQKAADYLERELEQKTIFREMLIGMDNCEGYYDDKTKRCYTCESEKTPKEVADTLCKMCPEREIRKGICQSTKKTKECHSRGGNWYMRYDWETGEELECEKCPDAADEEKKYSMHAEGQECLRCPNWTTDIGENVSFYGCYSCIHNLDHIYSLSRTIPLNERCPDWIWDEQMRQYHIPACPNRNQFLGMNEYNNKVLCQECKEDTIIRTTEEECNKCSEREFYYGDLFSQGTFYLTDNITGEEIEEIGLIQEGLCILKQNNNQYTFTEIDGKKYLNDAKFFIDGNINTQNPFTGNTVLMEYIKDYTHYYSDYKKIEELINRGIDVNIKNKNGETALSIAINKGHNDILDLFKGKTDINNQDENGETLLHYIIRDPLLNNSIDFIFASNPDVNIINNKGENIFQYFVRIVQENLKNKYGQDKEEEIQRLSDIAKGLIHAKTPYSGYALCEMFNQEELEIANRMELAGADLTNIFICPGIWETDWIYPEKMGYLIRFGANVNAVDKTTGMTPLKYAIATDAGRIVINFLKQQGAKE